MGIALSDLPAHLQAQVKAQMGKRKASKPPTEHAEQCAVIAWAKEHEAKYPALRWLHAIPNGGKRHPATAKKLKAEGVKSGVADLLLPYSARGYHGLYIEMKRRGKLTNVSDSQAEFGEYCLENGYAYLVRDNHEDVISDYLWYLGAQERT